MTLIKCEKLRLSTWLGLFNIFDNRENLPLKKIRQESFLCIWFFNRRDSSYIMFLMLLWFDVTAFNQSKFSSHFLNFVP